jgi:hypothetical protein
MTPQPTAAALLTLDPATTDETLATIFGALRRDPDRTAAQRQTQRDAGAALIAALRPRNPVEAIFAVRAAAAHYGSIECLRRTMLPDTPDNAGIRWAGKAVALSKLSTEMIHALQQSQAATPRALPQALAQSQPGARPAAPLPAAPAAAGQTKAAVAAKSGRGRAPMSAGRQDPMPSERPSPAPEAAPVTAQPAVPPPPAPAAAARPEAAVPTKPAGGQVPMSAGKQDPMSSERPTPVPIAFRLKGWPAPAAFPFKTRPVAAALFQPAPADPLLPATPARQGQRAALLGSTSVASGVVAAEKV